MPFSNSPKYHLVPAYKHFFAIYGTFIEMNGFPLGVFSLCDFGDDLAFQSQLETGEKSWLKRNGAIFFDLYSQKHF